MSGALRGAGLPAVPELFARAALVYQERWRLALSIVLLGFGAVVVPFAAALVLSLGALFFAPGLSDVVVITAMTAACVFAVFVSVWSQAALLLAAALPAPAPSLAVCLEASWRRLPGFLLTGCLYLAACVGGTCLLVLPGLMASLCLAFGPLIYLTEDVGPVEALLKSWGYMRGRLWAVAGRFFAICIAGSLPGFIPLAGAPLQILAWPLVLMSLAVLLEDLRRLRGAEPLVSARWGKAVVFVLAGFSLVPLLLLPWVLPWIMGYAANHSDQLFRLLVRSR
jgi:hypothetical protein